jgi:hypothetical protein
MKYLNCFLFVCSTTSLLSQNYNEEKYVPSVPGLRMVIDASMIQYHPRGNSNPGSKYSNSIRASIEGDLLNAARKDLREYLDKKRIQNLYKKRAFDKETVLASYWLESPTGLMSGVTWWDLPESEKSVFRRNFAHHWSRDPEDSKINELEDELAMAWAQSKRGQRDGRPWRHIPEHEKKNLRDNYLKRKEIGLLKTEGTVEQNEYENAWASLKSKGLVDKHWWQLKPSDRNKFRKAFYQVTQRANVNLLAQRKDTRDDRLLAKN